LQSNPLWGPRQNLVVPVGMVGTALIAIVNLYGSGLQKVFYTRPIPAMFWGPPFAFALAILIVDELRKLIVRTYPKVSHDCLRATMSPTNCVGLVDHCQDGMVTYWASRSTWLFARSHLSFVCYILEGSVDMMHCDMFGD